MAGVIHLWEAWVYFKAALHNFGVGDVQFLQGLQQIGFAYVTKWANKIGPNFDFHELSQLQ